MLGDRLRGWRRGIFQLCGFYCRPILLLREILCDLIHQNTRNLVVYIYICRFLLYIV